jgi:uncharacterized protein (DUF952 family)
LWVLKLRFSWPDKTNWDTPGCPHLYGNFGAADVESVKEFNRSKDETWEQAMGNETAWLE